ncbi:hypothetical protein [Burkholderia sp. Ac-20365]|uniref:hypothetical protein n=1 Tax=Burkholderia sp. Ac-20365 TaxID=2703897 RepID=UPI00197C7534|nr:hypothetical protein [Burkholderia sp. Ac-20365]MBN3761156.1 hypothetical protein [Burkholderia sp. Ac-20365]
MPTRICNRVDLAFEQLEAAIRLFLDDKSYAAVITLAGAAERVLGQALRRAGKEACLDWSFGETAPVHLVLHGEPLNKKVYADAQNRVSNALRHFDASDSPDFEADLDEAACWMLVRACENGHRLGRVVQGYDEFDAWFMEHVVGM